MGASHADRFALKYRSPSLWQNNEATPCSQEPSHLTCSIDTVARMPAEFNKIVTVFAYQVLELVLYV